MFKKKGSEIFEQGQERITEIGRRLGAMFGQEKKTVSTDIEGFLKGVGSLVEQLGKLSEQAHKVGDEVSRSGVLNTGKKTRLTGVYGFTVKSALDKNSVKVEPFGNIYKDQNLGEIEIQEIREPLIDIFDESDYLLIIAEVPGIVQDDIRLELKDDILIFSAENGEKKYRKEMLLQDSYSAQNMNYLCRNGVLEIKIFKSH
jgi:HSP20 family protein